MKPPVFEYFRARSVDEAVALLAEHGDDARPLAGGQSLVPAMNFRLAAPTVLVDLNEVEALAYIDPDTEGGIRIGAMTRQRQLERSATVAARAPLIAELLPYVSHAQIRNRGTLGGSLANADPAAELPAAMLALDATMNLRGPDGARSVAAAAFFTGLYETAIAPGELLTEIVLPTPGVRTGAAFVEVARRRGDFALTGVAAVVALDASGRCEHVRIAVCGAGDRVTLAEQAGASLLGEMPAAAVREDAARIAAECDVTSHDDHHASADYRRSLVRVLTKRTLERAAGRAAAMRGD